MDLAGFARLAIRDLPFPSPCIGIAMMWHRRIDNHRAHPWLRRAIRASLMEQAAIANRAEAGVSPVR